MSSLASQPWLSEVEYPESDGLPMAESDAARDYLVYAVEALSLYFQADPQVYVSGNLFIYYEQGNPKAVVAPDVFVVFGVEKGKRRVYKTWEEQDRVPSFVLEITSKSTATEDQRTKKQLYANLGVQEYFQYDPTGDYLDPCLQGFTLQDGIYRPLTKQDLGSEQLQIWSQALGLWLRVESGQLRFWENRQQQGLPTYQEIDQARQAASDRAEQERQRAEQERQRAEQEQQRAERLAERLRDLGIDPEDL